MQREQCARWRFELTLLRAESDVRRETCNDGAMEASVIGRVFRVAHFQFEVLRKELFQLLHGV